MQVSYSRFRFVLICAILFMGAQAFAADKKPSPEFYQIKVYHFNKPEQGKIIDEYLQSAYVPALHRAGIQKVGVFKPLANDTAADKIIYVFIPATNAEKLINLSAVIEKDAAHNTAGKTYLEAVYTNPPYTRIETILLRAFRKALQMEMPKLSGAHSEHIYELRSYESATENLYLNKVKMFNEGGEVTLFKRLGFNAVFYADVISGAHMPNLMYMTSFDNIEKREKLWKSFGDDPVWKTLSTMPEYQHNVSKADIILMHATDYSDL
jgi:NIPSNAP